MWACLFWIYVILHIVFFFLWKEAFQLHFWLIRPDLQTQIIASIQVLLLWHLFNAYKWHSCRQKEIYIQKIPLSTRKVWKFLARVGSSWFLQYGNGSNTLARDILLTATAYCKKNTKNIANLVLSQNVVYYIKNVQCGNTT